MFQVLTAALSGQNWYDIFQIHITSEKRNALSIRRKLDEILQMALYNGRAQQQIGTCGFVENWEKQYRCIYYLEKIKRKILFKLIA